MLPLHTLHTLPTMHTQSPPPHPHASTHPSRPPHTTHAPTSLLPPPLDLHNGLRVTSEDVSGGRDVVPAPEKHSAVSSVYGWHQHHGNSMTQWLHGVHVYVCMCVGMCIHKSVYFLNYSGWSLQFTTKPLWSLEISLAAIVNQPIHSIPFLTCLHFKPPPFLSCLHFKLPPF